jgi:hypothetical protein
MIYLHYKGLNNSFVLFETKLKTAIKVYFIFQILDFRTINLMGVIIFPAEGRIGKRTNMRGLFASY